MSEHNQIMHESDEHRSSARREAPSSARCLSPAAEPVGNVPLSHRLAHLGSESSARANGVVRAASIERAQRTHGNRSLQRKLAGHSGVRTVPVQRDPDEEERRLRFSALPPTLSAPLGPLDGTLTLGGPQLSYERDRFHADAEYSWGGPLDLSMGYGARLQPWLMDAQPALSAGGAALPGFLSNPLAPGGLGAVGGMAGMLGDIADSGGPAPPWGVGLQASIGPEEQRVMAGLRLNF